MSSSAEAKDGPGSTFGLGASARQIYLTQGLAETFTEDAPGGTRQQGFSIEFARRGHSLEFVLGFGYDKLEAVNGYYLENAGNALTPGKVDYTEFDGFHWFTIDATLVGYAKLHKILALRYGGGLGVAYLRGEILRTDAECSTENIHTDCVPDPDGAQQRDPVNLPPALPVLNAFVGLQFRPVSKLAINLDAGIHNVPYLGASVMFYLW